MTPLYRNLIIGTVVLVAVISFVLVRFLTAAGQFTTLTAAMEIPGECDVIESVPGPEDIVVDHERGLAFVSSVDRRALLAGATGVRGGVYVIDLTAPRAEWALRPVTPHVPAAFDPHGLGLYIDDEGRRTLMVVNHADGVHTIEMFDVDDDGILSHRATVADPKLVSPNDVQPVGHSAFYATNDHGTGSATGQLLHDALLLAQANLVYFDGQSMRVVADGFSFANGVNVSPDGKSVYVAETIGMALRIFQRDIESGDLTPFDFVALGTGLDNVDVSPDGTLLIGAHPRLIDFLSHASDENVLSPSQVVRLTPREGGGGTADTIYLNLGDQLSASATAAAYGDTMLVSGVFDPKILACTIPPAPAQN